MGYFYLSLQACQNTVRSHDTTCTLDCPTCDNLCSCRYCQAVYPSKDVSNIVEANKRVLVDNSLVTPYRCLGWYKKLNACVCTNPHLCTMYMWLNDVRFLNKILYVYIVFFKRASLMLKWNLWMTIECLTFILMKEFL